MIDSLHTTLAACIRTHVRCQCETKAFWPWKREVTCARCVALEAYGIRLAAADAQQQEKR